MPRGSKIGERRGGRERGTPNRRTVLADRILDIAPEYATASASQFVEVLVKDRKLPADIRMAIALEFSPAGGSRSGVAKSSVEPRPRAKSSGTRRVPSRAAKLASLKVLLSIAQDTCAHPVQRRKAAAEAAQHFLPKKPGPKRWWNNAPTDECGFAITPEIAAEYRDSKFELRRLTRSGGNSAATVRRAAKMRTRLESILHRLQYPCPSKYGRDQWDADGRRLVEFLYRRENNNTLSESEYAEEAHCRARFDCFSAGPESAAQERLYQLLDKERVSRSAFGPPLTWKEQVDLRFLRLLYQQHNRRAFIQTMFDYEPLRDHPLSKDGNLYPADSKLRPLEDGEIAEEFVDLPPFVIGDPNRPGHRWYWSPPK